MGAYAEIAQAFDNMAQSKLLQFCGPSPRSCFETVRGFVKAVASSSRPAVEKATESAFMTRVKAKLALWCTAEVTGEDGSKEKKVGRAAAQARLKQLEEQQAQQKEVSFADVLPVASDKIFQN